MPVQVKTTLNFKPLITIRTGLAQPIGVKVGILGNDDSRQGEGALLGNAGIGVVQEFGSLTNNIPPRSFLRMPLETKKDRLEATFEKVGVKQKLLEGDARGALQSLGFVAEQIIDDAFKSQGFGNWAPNKPSTVAKKGSSKPLIDTSQLRRSITSKVQEKA